MEGIDEDAIIHGSKNTLEERVYLPEHLLKDELDENDIPDHEMDKYLKTEDEVQLAKVMYIFDNSKPKK